MRKATILLTGLLILAVVNLSIWQKQKHLAEGRVVFLELAPVDPRSLMQGDYMALNYVIATRIQAELPKNENGRWRRDLKAADGYAVVSLDDRRVASYQRLYQGEELAEGEFLLRFRARGGQLKFATNAYFFQEGTGESFEDAAYGLFRVNEAGEPLLSNLADKDLTILGN